MMGYPCVRLPEKFLASYDDKARCLIVKLPRERVAEHVDGGGGDPFAPAGKVFREWVPSPLSTVPVAATAGRSGRVRAARTGRIAPRVRAVGRRRGQLTGAGDAR